MRRVLFMLSSFERHQCCPRSDLRAMPCCAWQPLTNLVTKWLKFTSSKFFLLLLDVKAVYLLSCSFEFCWLWHSTKIHLLPQIKTDFSADEFLMVGRIKPWGHTLSWRMNRQQVSSVRQSLSLPGYCTIYEREPMSFQKKWWKQSSQLPAPITTAAHLQGHWSLYSYHSLLAWKSRLRLSLGCF